MEPDDISHIGPELVHAAREWERTPGDMLGELFPYVFEASRTMSTRAISRWLSENHGVEISQPTISRALRKPDKYWQAFADFIEPHARTVERFVDFTTEEILFDYRLFDWALDRDLNFPGETQEAIEEQLTELRRAEQFLRDRWFCLSSETVAHVRSYLVDEPTKEAGK